MSSPMGEPPIRRHLPLQVEALTVQAALGARQRALRRRAVLRGARGADPEWLIGGPLSVAEAEAAAAAPALMVPAAERATGAEGAVIGPVTAPGAAAPPIRVPQSRVPVAVTSPAGPGAEALQPEAVAPTAEAAPVAQAIPVPNVIPNVLPKAVPPLARLMTAAALRAGRAEALRREALMAPTAPRGTAANLPMLASTDAHHPAGAPPAVKQDRISAAAEGAQVRNGAFPTPRLQGPLKSETPAPGAAPRAEPSHPGPPGAPPRAWAPAGAPGPAQAPGPGWPPALAAPAPPAAQPLTPAAPAAQEGLLAEERLREQLARILRADALRHGLDLKER